MPDTVLEHHDRIVHEPADGECKPAERHHVDGVAREVQADERRQDRERDRKEDDARRAHAAEEHEHHQRGEDAAESHLACHAANRRPYER